MRFKKQGMPEDGELVFCTVTNVQYNSVFVQIEEYSKQGLIHISEISPGRIRNIRDYVKEGKMIVCKVIKIDRSRGNIDLSLRRVTEMQKRHKTDERKQEQKAENILETLATHLNKKPDIVYKEISQILLPKYEMLQYAFEDVVENNMQLEKVGVPKEYAEKLEALVKEKIKPKIVHISGKIIIKSYAKAGIDDVKAALSKSQKAEENVKISYLGAGQYAIIVEAKDYKEAEKRLKGSLDVLSEIFEHDKNVEYRFERNEKKD